MARNETHEPRNRSNSLSAAWSYLWRGAGSKHSQQQPPLSPSGHSSRAKHHTIKEEDDDEVDRALGKGITRKVLPQQRRSTSSVHSSPAGSSRSSPRLEPRRSSVQPTALERIAIHNSNINEALASTMAHSAGLNGRQDQEDIEANLTGNLAQHPSHCQTQSFASVQQQGESGERVEGQLGSLGKRVDVGGTESMVRSGSQSADVVGDCSLEGTSTSGTSGKTQGSTSGLSSAPSSASSPSSVPPALASPHGSQEPSEPMCQLDPVSGPSYFDITPTVSHPSPPTDKKSAFATKTPSRKSKRTPAHSISSTMTNNGPPTSRRVSCTNTDTASQNSTSYLDEQDVEIDENSFYIHLQRMQDRYLAQQEPGWLRTQHALLQAKHRTPGAHDSKNTPSSRKSGFMPGSQPFLSRTNHPNNSSPSSSDYSSSPSLYPAFHSTSHRSQGRDGLAGSASQLRHQPTHAFNCFQPGNVICVPKERSLGGLIFHKTFVETHILTPSPYYQGQYLTLDHKVVEIDKDHVKEISGFAHPRSVQILSEETVYNSSSQKPTRVLILDRPLEGDGVVQARSMDGPIMPNLRRFESDIAFLESFPELSRALRDFNNLCQEFENTYVYIRGFATYTLDKLRLIYEKAYRDCLGDSVKLQKLVLRGVQAEQDCFAELIENVVLGKLYQKLFLHSLVPCYAQRDIEVDETIARYHHFLFSLGGHRGMDANVCLASSDSPLLQDALRKLGLSEKLRNMRVDHALERAAGLFRAWDQKPQESHDQGRPLVKSQNDPKRASVEETEQEMKRRQLRESLRIIVQDERSGLGMHLRQDAEDVKRDDEDPTDDDEESMLESMCNTPLEKVNSIKHVLDRIAAVAEDHLINGQEIGFVQKKRSDVSVTTDDFIPLLAIVIIQARLMRLGSNMFYLQRFRLNAPKSDVSFALVTFEASVEFLKTDPLGLLTADQNPSAPASASASVVSLVPAPKEPASGNSLPSNIDFELKSPTDETPIMPWGTPSQTGWGFSPPNTTSFAPAFDLLSPGSESNALSPSAAEPSPVRPGLMYRHSDNSHQFQRHARSSSMNFDDRLRRMGYSEDAGSGSSSNSSWSRSPMLGPRFSSGTSSPLGAMSPNHGSGNGSTDSAGTMPMGARDRRASHNAQILPSSQRHSISNGQAHMYAYTQPPYQPQHHLHRISVEQGRETMSRSTILPLQSANMTPQLVVKPQIMLPPPTTPPMSGQNTSGRARPMSMIVVGALASSAYSSSYSGLGSSLPRNRPYSSHHSSPATSPRLGPGLGSRQSSSRSNSLMSGPFPMARANSMTSALLTGQGSDATTKGRDQSEPLSPLSPLGTSRPPFSPLSTESGTESHFGVLTDSPVMSAVSTSVEIPQTPNRMKPLRSASLQPSRIRTSPSSTTSSISTPTTPTTFAPSNAASALMNSLSANAQMNSSSPGTSAGSISSKTTLVTDSPPGSVHGITSSKSSIDRRHSTRLALPKLALSPSAPSTMFCKTTVTTDGSHTTTTTSTLDVQDSTSSFSPLELAQSSRGTQELPTLEKFSSSHSRARSPAISMANSPFMFSDLGEGSARAESTSENASLGHGGSTGTLERQSSWISSNGGNPSERIQKESPAAPTVERFPAALGRPTVERNPSQSRGDAGSFVPPSSLQARTSSKTPSLNLPLFPQQQSFQGMGRQAAPEIISLASPLTGSIVNRTVVSDVKVLGLGGSSHGSVGSLAGGNYIQSASSLSLGQSLAMARRSLDAPRPSTGLGFYGSSSSVSSFGSHSGEFRQPSPLQSSSLRQQHPLSSYSGHQRQHSASATASSYLSAVASSFHGQGPLARGLGIHTPGHSSSSNSGSEGGPSSFKESRVSMGSPSMTAGSTPRSLMARGVEGGHPSRPSSALLLENSVASIESNSEGWTGALGGSGSSPTSEAAAEVAAATVAAAAGMGDGRISMNGAVHVKMDSGKYVQAPPPVALTSHSDHVSSGTALDFEPQSLKDHHGFGLAGVGGSSSESRRGSATSLRTARSGQFYVDKGTLSWNHQLDTTTAGSGTRSRLSHSSGDLPSKVTVATTPSSSSNTTTQTTHTRQMMGEFLSELAKVEDGDVLVGNGRHGVTSRQ